MSLIKSFYNVDTRYSSIGYFRWIKVRTSEVKHNLLNILSPSVKCPQYETRCTVPRLIICYIFGSYKTLCIWGLCFFSWFFIELDNKIPEKVRSLFDHKNNHFNVVIDHRALQCWF